MNQEQAISKLEKFMQGNQWAIDICLQLNFIGELWDDLIDGDNPRSEEDVNKAFMNALVNLPANPLYRQHQDEFVPLIVSAMLAWHDSNTLKNGDDHDKHMAYMLKQELSRIFHYCAFLVGGFEWAVKIGPHMCRMFTEPLEDYMKEVS
jgi:hypothetical protein